MSLINYRGIIEESIANESLKGFTKEYFQREQKNRPDYSRQEFYQGLKLAVNEIMSKLHSEFKSNNVRHLENKRRNEEKIKYCEDAVHQIKTGSNNQVLIKEYRGHIKSLKQENVSIDDLVNQSSIEAFIMEEYLAFEDGSAVRKVSITISLLKEILQDIENCLNGNEINDDKNEKSNSTRLSDHFESVSHYKKIMELLGSKGLCNPNTYLWIDEQKGNRGYPAAIIKHLHGQGYLKKRITQAEIKAIVLATFKFDISLATVKGAKIESFDLGFIPLASTL